MTWHLPWEVNGSEVRIHLADRLIATHSGSVHSGLTVVVELTADSLDEANERTQLLASLNCSFLSAAARAPVMAMEPQVLYSLRIDSINELRQWYRGFSFPVGKTPAPPDVFNRIQKAYTELVSTPGEN